MNHIKKAFNVYVIKSKQEVSSDLNPFEMFKAGYQVAESNRDKDLRLAFKAGVRWARDTKVGATVTEIKLIECKSKL